MKSSKGHSVDKPIECKLCSQIHETHISCDEHASMMGMDKPVEYIRCVCGGMLNCDQCGGGGIVGEIPTVLCPSTHGTDYTIPTPDSSLDELYEVILQWDCLRKSDLVVPKEDIKDLAKAIREYISSQLPKEMPVPIEPLPSKDISYARGWNEYKEVCIAKLKEIA